MRLVYQALASHIRCRAACQGNEDRAAGYEQADHWRMMGALETEAIDAIMQSAPSGAGLDGGTLFATDVSTPNKLVFRTSYHHMNDGGSYDGWTKHVVTVRPSLQFGFTLKISGRNRNGVMDYLYEVFYVWLRSEVS